MPAYEACIVGKAHQQNLGNNLLEQVIVHNRMKVHLDKSLIKKPDSVARVFKPHMHIIVMEVMQLKFTNFFETKDGIFAAIILSVQCI